MVHVHVPVCEALQITHLYRWSVWHLVLTHLYSSTFGNAGLGLNYNVSQKQQPNVMRYRARARTSPPPLPWATPLPCMTSVNISTFDDKSTKSFAFNHSHNPQMLQPQTVQCICELSCSP